MCGRFELQFASSLFALVILLPIWPKAKPDVVVGASAYVANCYRGFWAADLSALGASCLDSDLLLSCLLLVSHARSHSFGYR